MKLREVLDTAKAAIAASHKVVVKDEPERDALNEGFFLGVAYAADKFKIFEDAEVYGFDTGKVSVVTVELRERGIAAMVGLTRGELADDVVQESIDGCPPIRYGQKEADETFEEVGKTFDAVLSVVLGDVRVAKFVGNIYQGNPESDDPMWLDTSLSFDDPAWPWPELKNGDDIALLAPQAREEVKENVDDSQNAPR